MGIGTSDGKYYEDDFAYTRAQFKQPETIEPETTSPYTPLTDGEAKSLLWDTPVVSSKGAYDKENPTLTPQGVQEMLDRPPEEHQKDYDEAVKVFGKDNVIGGPSPAGRIRGWKDIPAFQEYMKKLPSDIDVHDMKDGTIIFRKRPAYTSEVETPFKVAGDVVPFPLTPKAPDNTRTWVYDPRNNSWKEQDAKIIPLPIKKSELDDTNTPSSSDLFGGDEGAKFDFGARDKENNKEMLKERSEEKLKEYRGEKLKEQFKKIVVAQNTIPSPSIVPEQSPNLEILKQIRELPKKPSPGTTKDSHPYHKNR